MKDATYKQVWEKWHRGGYTHFLDSAFCRGFVLKYLAGMPNLKEYKVLDIGCGQGVAFHWLFDKVKEYHGVDISKTCVLLGQKMFKDRKNVFFHENNGEDLSMFKDGTFDLVVCFIAFQHMPKENVRKYMDEIYRVLKLNGTAILQFTHDPERSEWTDAYLDKTRDEASQEGYNPLNADVKLYLSWNEPEIVGALEATGFNLDTIVEYPFISDLFPKVSWIVAEVSKA